MRYQAGKQIFDTEAEAQAALPAAQAALLVSEDYRFCFATVITNGSDTTWRNPVESDPEDGLYQVFNHKTGAHEPFTKKSAAQTRLQKIKQEFLVETGFDKVYEYIPPVGPNNTMPTSIL